MSNPPASPQWLHDQLTALLAAPYIHFSHPPQLAGRRLGHGPVDLFSTRFNQLFADDASAVVAGAPVDRDALKDALLGLQKHWRPDAAHYAPLDEPQTGVRMQWTPAHSDKQVHLVVSASVHDDEYGTPHIKSINLDGDHALFSR